MHRVALVVLLSCGGNHAAAPPAPAGRTPIVVRDTGVGPIDANAKASVDGLQPLLPGYQIKSEYPPGLDAAHNLGPPDVHVYADGERQLIVLASDRGTVLRVLVVSPRVESQIGWRVGGALTDPSLLGRCECMADGLGCFAKSGRVGAVIDEDCTRKLEADAMAGRSVVRAAYKQLEAGDPAALAGLKGRSIRMLVWRSPDRGAGGRDDDPPPPPPED